MKRWLAALLVLILVMSMILTACDETDEDIDDTQESEDEQNSETEKDKEDSDEEKEENNESDSKETEKETEKDSEQETEPSGKETDSEETEPEGTEPEGTEPEGTEPEGTEPEGTEPEGTEPEGTKPEGTEPEGTEPEGTEPEGTEPEGTEPEGTEPEGGENTEPPAGDDTETPEPIGGQTVYTYKGELISQTVMDAAKAAFENTATGKTPYEPSVAPFALHDDLGLANKKITSITLPLAVTIGDTNTDTYYFTIFVYKKTDLKKESIPQATYKIAVSAAEYNLKGATEVKPAGHKYAGKYAVENINRFITIDLTRYDISYKSDETLAFFDEDDTFIPWYFGSASNVTTEVIDKNTYAGVLKGFDLSVGKSNARSDSSNSLLLNLTYEQTFDNEAAYNAVVEAEKTRKGVYSYEFSYFSDEEFKTIKNMFEQRRFEGYQYNLPGAPYSLTADLGISNAKLTSVSIPVMSTKKADANGDYIFTLYVYNRNTVTVKNAVPDATFKIRVNGAQYGLVDDETEILKFITVDLRDYDINIGSDQILAYACGTVQPGTGATVAQDTLLPAYLTALPGELNKYIKENYPNLYGFASNVGKSNASAGTAGSIEGGNAILLNFTWQRDFNSKTVYNSEIKNAANAPSKTVYTLQENYIPSATFEKIKNAFETQKNANTFANGEGPFAIPDFRGISGAKLIKISIPVMATGVSENGYYTFTLNVFRNDPNSIANSKPVWIYKIKIRASDYNLSDNTAGIYKFITVDVSDYNIVLADHEMLAFGAVGDTLLPAWFESKHSYMLDILRAEFPEMYGFIKKIGKQTLNLTQHLDAAILFDFVVERTYTDPDEYLANKNEEVDFAKMLEAIQNAYGNKKLSIMGDSISTFPNVSNNASYNSTIGGNDLWYYVGRGGISEYKYTYWGKMLENFGMNLCVNNAWSGDSLGNTSPNRGLSRAEQLHNNANEHPDLIVVYFGINDSWNHGSGGRKVGSLPELLRTRGTKTENQVVQEWLQGVLVKNGNTDKWDELYATMISRITTKYSGAKVICVQLTDHKHVNYDPTVIDSYNIALEAIANYFGCPMVEQKNVINAQNHHGHTADAENYFLHPDLSGHKLLFEEIVRTLYNDLKNK